MGGLPRRHTLLDDARERGPLLVLDGGRSLSPRTPATPRELDQRRIKARAVARAFTAGGIDAMTVAGGDWSLGTEFVRALVTEHHLPVLVANLVCDGVAPYPSGKVIEQAGMRIGVVAVTEGTVEGCTVTEPRQAIRDAIAALGPVDIRIGLVPVENDRALAALAAPAPGEVQGDASLPLDLVIDGRGLPPDQSGDLRGANYWISGGQQGKKLGFVELEMVPGGVRWEVEGARKSGQSRIDIIQSRLEGLDRRIGAATDDATRTRLTAQRDAYATQLGEARAAEARTEATGVAHRALVTSVDLGAEVKDQPVSAAIVADAKAEITALAGTDPRAFVPRSVVDVESPYAGGEACAGCHDAEHAQWSTTPHARAWNGLVNVDRAFDEACWSCHVTGADLPGGPTEARAAGAFRDVQCEACHGPGRAHAAAPATAAIPVAKPGVPQCVGCHDGQQDQGRFDAGTYLPKVIHTAPTRP